MLMRWDPFRDLDHPFWRNFGEGVRSPGMAIDAYRHGDQFIVAFDLPGVDPKSIDVTVDKNVLTVKAKREWQLGDVEVVVSERSHGEYTRQLYLADGLDTDHIDAHYENGVLTLTIMVAEAARPKKIEITPGSTYEAIEASTSHAA